MSEALLGEMDLEPETEERIQSGGFRRDTDSIHSGMTKREQWAAVANRVMYSKPYLLVYIGVAVVSLGMLIWSLVESRINGWYIALDILINILITAEVVIRIVAITTPVFFRSVLNVVDVFLVVLFWVFTILEIVDVSNDSLKDFFIGGRTAIILVRSSMQIIRTLRILSVQRRRQRLGTLDIYTRPQPMLDDVPMDLDIIHHRDNHDGDHKSPYMLYDRY